jgi:DNA replication protein DnaC
VVTSNRTPEEWLSMMAEPLLAQSAVDRLVSTSHELIIEGESYRRRQKPAISHSPGLTIDDKNGDHHDHS